MKKVKSKNSISIYLVVVLTILLIYSILMFSLLGWGVMKSLQTREDYILSNSSAYSIPKEWTLQNYIDAFNQIHYKFRDEEGLHYVYFGEMVFNSLFYSIGCTIVSTLTPCVIAYLTIKYDFRFNKVLNFIVYFTMLVHFLGSMPSSIKVVTALGLIDTWPGIFIMKFNFLGQYYLIFQGIFRGLSREYSEAAIIDGASDFTLMVKINFPLIFNSIIIVAVLEFIGYWNDYQTPMVYLRSHPTVSYGLYYFNGINDSKFGMLIYKVAGFMLMMLPTLLLFLIFKNKMIGNLTIGGLKG